MTRPSGSRGLVRQSGVLEAEAHLEADLIVRDLAVDDLAADLGDLEPVQVPQGLPGPVQSTADGGLDPLGRGSDDLGDAVRALAHLSSTYPQAVNPDIARLEQQARGLLPAAVYDYYAGGSGRERTLPANERAWAGTWLAPPVLRGVSQ